MLTRSSDSPSPPHISWRDVGVIVSLVLTLVFVFLYTWPVYPTTLSTISQYYEHAQRMWLGQQPYSDFVFEYPPLAIPLFFLPVIGVPHGDLDRYRLQFAIEQAVLGVALGWLMLRLLRRDYGGRGLLGPLVALPVFYLMAGVMATLERYDLAPALVTLAAIYVWPRQQGLLSWPLLAIGAALKVYPILLAPLLALEHIQRREWRALGRNLAIFGVTLLMAFLPSLSTGLDVVRVLFAYHGERGLEINSLWATPLLVAYTRGLPLEIAQAFSAEEVRAPGAALFARLAVPTILLLLAGVYWLYWRRLQRADPSPIPSPTKGGEKSRGKVTSPVSPPARIGTGDGGGSIPRLVRFSALTILAFVLPNKVLSPQYMVWLIPFIPLLRDRHPWLVWGLFAFILALSQYIYPHHWIDLVSLLDPRAILAVVARNILLIPLFVLLFEQDEGHVPEA